MPGTGDKDQVYISYHITKSGESEWELILYI